MILWILELLGMEDSWTLELKGVSIILESMIVIDAIWMLLLLSDLVNDKIRRSCGSGKKEQKKD